MTESTISSSEIDEFCKEFFKNPIHKIIFERLDKV